MKCSHKTHLLSAAPLQEAMLSSYTRVFFTLLRRLTMKTLLMRGSLVSEHLGLSYVSATTLNTSLNSSPQYSWKDLLTAHDLGKDLPFFGFRITWGARKNSSGKVLIFSRLYEVVAISHLVQLPMSSALLPSLI